MAPVGIKDFVKCTGCGMPAQGLACEAKDSKRLKASTDQLSSDDHGPLYNILDCSHTIDAADKEAFNVL